MRKPKKNLSMLEAVRGAVKLSELEVTQGSLLSPPPGAGAPDINYQVLQRKYPSVSSEVLDKIKRAPIKKGFYQIDRNLLPNNIDPEEFAQDFSSAFGLRQMMGIQFNDDGFGDNKNIEKAKELNFTRTQSGSDPFADFEEKEELTPNQENEEAQQWKKQWERHGSKSGRTSPSQKRTPAVNAFDKMPSIENVASRRPRRQRPRARVELGNFAPGRN